MLKAPSRKNKPAFAEFPVQVEEAQRHRETTLARVLEHGGPGYLQFAITNICNAKCDFCGFAVDASTRSSDIASLSRKQKMLSTSQLPDVCRKIRHANEVFAELGIRNFTSLKAVWDSREWIGGL